MNEENKNNQPERVDRRELVRRGAKAAYIVPAILAVVKATERPAYAQSSGSPQALPQLPPQLPPPQIN